MQNTPDDMQRKQIIAAGQVQGVGFRPFVYRIAKIHNLCGHVGNTTQGVCIEIQGTSQNISAFIDDLKGKLPPLAKLSSCEVINIPIKQDTDFTIIKSQGAGGHSVLISADTSICTDCLQDMSNLSNVRYNYAFTNCTNCGPRYTITHSIPYDRATTSMACFALCNICHAEYHDPTNRRFHAQPNACPKCGPSLWCVENHTELAKCTYENAPARLQGDAALKTLAIHLKNGKIAAIKGLGGFHLSCDATNELSVAQLRKCKNRPHKPLALMVPNLAMAKRIAHLGEQEEYLLSCAEKPIVLCKKREHALPEIIAPDADSIGLILPYTPLHVVLFNHFAKLCRGDDIIALVMTSGNAGGEPICLGNREALSRLKHITDVFLLHNRDILVRTDDSVCKFTETINQSFNNQNPEITQKRITFLRRARGYVPRPIKVQSMPQDAPAILGMGAELKSTLCLNRGDMAFISQHIGDLQNVETLGFYNEVLQHLEMLLQVQPAAIVHDLHPNFMSTQVAQNLSKERGIACFALQHHFAHAWAVLAEHDFNGEALALTLDGTGLGLDNTIWGGELLYINTQNLEHKRMGRLSPFSLAGGDAATKEPWRIALALANGTRFERQLLDIHEQFGPAVLEMLKRNINCPQTSSVGRLFDAVAAGLGLCTHTSYEGQAAIRLEYAQHGLNLQHAEINKHASFTPTMINDLWELPSQELFMASLSDYEQAQDVAHAARRFHINLAQGFAQMAHLAARENDIKTIVLTGGAMQNSTLNALLPYLLEQKGLQVLMHVNAPTNDGGVSLGQVAWGAKKLRTDAIFT